MQSYLSPIAIALLIMGVFMLVLPPLGIALLAAAVVTQSRYRGRVNGEAHRQARERRLKAYERQQSQKMAAARSFL